MLELINNDKVLHVIAGFAIMVNCTVIINLFFQLPVFVAAVLSLLFSIAIGCIKELCDRFTSKGTPEMLDAAMTAIGAIIGYVLVMRLQ